MSACLCFKDRRSYERLHLHRDAGNGQARLVHKRTLQGEWLERLGEVQACVWVNWGAEPPDTTLRVTQQTILKRDLMFLGNWTILGARQRASNTQETRVRIWKRRTAVETAVSGQASLDVGLKGSDINSQSPPGQSSALPPAYTL